LELVQASTSVVAVLAGHIHQPQVRICPPFGPFSVTLCSGLAHILLSFAQVHPLLGAGGACQFVTAAAKDGGSRLLSFVPSLSSAVAADGSGGGAKL